MSSDIDLSPGSAASSESGLRAKREGIVNPPAPRAVAETIILELLAAGAAGKTVAPEEVARALAKDADWHIHLVTVRRAAVSLASAGRLVIYRKGKPVDPADFKGVYRLGLPRQD
jgi:hypothetical protein